MEQKGVTIKDIADDLKVSLTTVHKVIYNKKGVSEQTRQRVLNYIQESGYHVNRAASSLKRRSLHLIYVGLTPPEANGFFYQHLSDGVHKAYESIRTFNVEMDFLVESQDADQQCELLEKLYDERRDSMDGLLLCCSHENRCTPLIRKFTSSGIPVVTVSSDAKNSTRSSYVGPDNVTVGRVAAEMITDLGIPANGQILLVSGYREFSNHQTVSSAFADYMAGERPDAEICDIYQSRSLLSTEKRIRNYLKAFPGISSAYSVTASGTYALCRAVQEEQMTGKIKVVGTDVFEELRPFFRDRVISATLFQDPYRQALTATNALYNIVSRELSVPEEQYIHISLAVRSNFDDFLK